MSGIPSDGQEHSLADLSRDTHRQPQSFCSLPMKLAGIQDSTPLSWSPCGKFLAFVAGNRTIFLSALTGDAETSFVPTAYLVGHKDPVADLAFHPNGDVLASVSSEGIFLWEVDELPDVAGAAKPTGMVEPFKRYGIDDSREAHEAAVECCAWIAGGTCLATGGRAGAVKIWDAEEGYAYVDTLHAHKAAVLAIASCPSTDTLATAGRDSTIFLWDIRPLAPENRTKRMEDASFRVNQLFRIDGHRGDIVSLVFSRDGDVLYSGARDNEIKVWNISSAKEMMSIATHKGDVNGLTLMNKDALLLSAAADGTVRLWDMSKIPELIRVTENFVAEDVNDLLDQDEVLVNPEKSRAEMIMTCRAHERDVQCMRVNPKLPLMVTASSQSCVRVWNIRDLANPAMVLEFVGHDAEVAAVRFIHGGQHFISGAGDYEVYLYDTAQLRRITALSCAGSVHCLAVSALEDIVYAGSTDYAIRAFDIAPGRPSTFKIVAQLEGHAGKVSSMVVSKDGSWLFSAGYDFDIYVWPLGGVHGGEARGDPVVVTPKNKIDAHDSRISCLVLNESGDRLASCGVDHAVFLWAVKGAKLSKVWRALNAHRSSVECATFGKGTTAAMLVTGSLDHEIKVWDSTMARGRSANIVPLVTLTGHTGRVTDLGVTLDGTRFVSASADGTARVWELGGSYACIAEYDCLNDGPITTLSVAEKFFLTGSANSMIRMWPLPSGETQSLFSAEKPKPRKPLGKRAAGKKNVLTRLEEAGDAVLANESGNQESEVARGKEAVDQGLYESNRSSTSSGSRS